MADQQRQDEIDAVEQTIDITKRRPGQEARVKKLEAELLVFKKKPMANAIARYHMILTKIAKDTEEKADKKIKAAEASLQTKWKQGAG